MKNKILIYNDSLELGGHEAVLLSFLSSNDAIRDYDIYFIISSNNRKLKKALEKMPAIYLIELKMNAIRVPLFLTWFCFIRFIKIAKQIKKIKPEVLLAVQGDFAISLSGLIVAKFMHIGAVSYLPMAHPHKKITMFLPAIKDFLAKIALKFPNKIITISQTQVEYLIKIFKVKRDKVQVVNNIIEVKDIAFTRMLKESNKHNSKKNQTIGLIGRIHFRQKGQDFLIDAISKDMNIYEQYRYKIIGEGPDKNKLVKLICDLGLTDLVEVMPWENDHIKIYQELDAIVIPSNYEGVPLVMLEAMYYKIPVIATNIDGMKELLPEEWLFDIGDHLEFKKRVKTVMNNNWDLVLEELRNKICTQYLRKNATEEFLSALFENRKIDVYK